MRVNQAGHISVHPNGLSNGVGLSVRRNLQCKKFQRRDRVWPSSRRRDFGQMELLISGGVCFGFQRSSHERDVYHRREWSARSLLPSFKIDTAANLYFISLANSLYFYQNERDGQPLRAAASHLNDANANVYVTPSIDNNGRFSGDLKPATFNGSQVVINAMGGSWMLAII
jgi:hypothetical protein